MLDQKLVTEALSRVKNYLSEGTIRVKGDKKHTKFFLTNAKNSLDSAESLLHHTKAGDYNGVLWVINASYYSMFYTLRALLESEGITLRRDSSIHALTFDALIYFFYQPKKLEKKLCEVFIEAQEEAAELLGKQAAHGLVFDYFQEKRKRGIFTYETGQLAMQHKAETSYNRALKFNADIRLIIRS